MIDLNVLGSRRFIKAAGSHITDGDRIGICSSLITLSQGKISGTEPYYVSKKLLEGVAEKIQSEYRDRGISVTTIRPGLVNTEAWSPTDRGLWKGVPGIIKVAGRLGFSAESCAENALQDVMNRERYSHPTLDAKLASKSETGMDLMAEASGAAMRGIFRAKRALK